MGSITFTVTETAKADATKTFTIPDADIDRFVAAWQQEANTAVNGTATRAQVLLTWANSTMDAAKQKVLAAEKAAQAAALVAPAPISAT